MPDEHGRTLRVVVCDDSTGYRTLISHWLDAEPDLELAAVAATGAEALTAVTELKPDVVVLDHVLPDVKDSTALAAHIRQASPGTAILLVSGMPMAILEHEAHEIRAEAFQTKASDPGALADGVRRADRARRGAGG